MLREGGRGGGLGQVRFQLRLLLLVVLEAAVVVGAGGLLHGGRVRQRGRGAKVGRRQVVALGKRGLLLLLLGWRSGRVREPLDLQAPCGLDEGGEVLLQHVDLPVVHVLHELLEVVRGHVLEVHDGMLVGPVRSPRAGQDGAEEGAADTQHELVRLEELPPAGQGHVRQGVGRAQVLHDGEERVVVVVPLKQELLSAHGGGGEGRSHRWKREKNRRKNSRSINSPAEPRDGEAEKIQV